jgi:hypothetical protein
VPEIARTARDLLVRSRQVARHDPLMVLRLINQMFFTFLGWIVLRTQAAGDPLRVAQQLYGKQQGAVHRI